MQLLKTWPRPIVLIAVCIGGCARTVATNGPEIESSSVAEIRKGVTTRQELVERFGTPASSQLMPDGKRIATFLSTRTTTEHNNKGWIPFAGPWVASGTRYSMRMQNLQVVFNKSDTVGDYEFSDQTSDTVMKSSALGGSAKTTRTDNTASK